ncbi:hypothetical protein PIB30_024734 [Stylosanthes scabra]|uniref:Uncharacterized protein n=1 Tax=Stylosanthes scabra TaxID=79078 RepID=A0ABU6SAK8_9FABA|nr:hypothetical protein [Stylosanthes scabra]
MDTLEFNQLNSHGTDMMQVISLIGMTDARRSLCSLMAMPKGNMECPNCTALE